MADAGLAMMSMVSRQCFQHLHMKWKVYNPEIVCSTLHDRAWDDRTKLELVLMLEAKGFLAKEYPPRRKTSLSGYAAGRKKVWYTSAHPPFAAYLQALLRMEERCRTKNHTYIHTTNLMTTK